VANDRSRGEKLESNPVVHPHNPWGADARLKHKAFDDLRHQAVSCRLLSTIDTALLGSTRRS